MKISTWEPASPDNGSLELTENQLNRLIAAGRNSADGVLRHDLAGEEIYSLRPASQKSQDWWQQYAHNLDNSGILALIRFFTLAEYTFEGWEANEHSSVIALNGILKARGQKLDRSFLHWIKLNSRNRFLPNGPLT